MKCLTSYLCHFFSFSTLVSLSSRPCSLASRPLTKAKAAAIKKAAHQRHDTDERRLALDESVLGALCLDVC